ncbi:hypothetical protein [Thalassotalea sediminis]|uniref:hypothetical protein n=1 Tax=Thalassotalea sediminis TaxID=1759089 RepID=UPI002573EB16|nr:hypothetical protein [Thalassotalea sediminis]
MKEKIHRIKETWRLIQSMPHIDINLMLDECQENDSFFSQITEECFNEATSRHPKLPLIKKRQFGMALFELNDQPDSYMKAVESSARRNYKKAVRNGFTFKRINFNEYIDDIWDIRRSAKVRQGAMPESFITNRPAEVCIPKSSTSTHDYPHFGIFNNAGKLVAYAACIVAGELIEVEHVYGHSDFQNYGIVPMLYISIAEYAVNHFTKAKYYAYGTFLGASDTMKRFKKKFKFLPHKVSWHLSTKK